MLNDPTENSFFVVLGLTGEGKSLFLNAISNTNCCEVGSYGKSCTQTNQVLPFTYNNHNFYALDTPGLDDSEDNNKKIKNLKQIIKEYRFIKK